MGPRGYVVVPSIGLGGPISLVNLDVFLLDFGDALLPEGGIEIRIILFAHFKIILV